MRKCKSEPALLVNTCYYCGKYIRVKYVFTYTLCNDCWTFFRPCRCFHVKYGNVWGYVLISYLL